MATGRFEPTCGAGGTTSAAGGTAATGSGTATTAGAPGARAGAAMAPTTMGWEVCGNGARTGLGAGWQRAGRCRSAAFRRLADLMRFARRLSVAQDGCFLDRFTTPW